MPAALGRGRGPQGLKCALGFGEHVLSWEAKFTVRKGWLLLLRSRDTASRLAWPARWPQVCVLSDSLRACKLPGPPYRYGKDFSYLRTWRVSGSQCGGDRWTGARCARMPCAWPSSCPASARSPSVHTCLNWICLVSCLVALFDSLHCVCAHLRANSLGACHFQYKS